MIELNERLIEGTSDAPTASSLAGGGETGAVLRAHDWSSSPLGDPSTWSQPLRTVVGIMLGSRQPMLVVWGPQRITLYNDGYATMCGDRHPAALGHPFRELWFDIWDDVEPILERAYAGEGTSMGDIQFTMHRSGYPEETHFAFSYTPVRDEGGHVAGMFCACQETTGEVFARRRIVAESERLTQMFQQAPGFIAMVRGPDHVFELTNAAYRQLVGHRDLIGKSVREALPEVEGQGFFEMLDEGFRTGEPIAGTAVPIQLQRAPGGPREDRFVDFVYQPIAGADGEVTGIFVEGSDVTERKLGEQHLQLMVNELHHRVKNSLATVQAIAAQTFRNADSFENSKRDFSARLVSLAQAHDILTEANWIGATLRNVIDKTVGPHRGDAGDRFDLDGQKVLLTPKSALAMSMALHELCTNAAKYGALSVEGGRVEIVWSVVEGGGEDRLHMTWTETGGPPVTSPDKKGFGSRLIEYGLAAELGGAVEIAFEPTGVICTIDASLPAA